MRQNTRRMEKSNAVSTLSSGDYGDDYSIRDHAQIQFLWTIQRCTPAPLYSLRDDVFPSYKAALDSERARAEPTRNSTSPSATHLLSSQLQITARLSSVGPNVRPPLGCKFESCLGRQHFQTSPRTRIKPIVGMLFRNRALNYGRPRRH
jgi:hypothetical protein